MQYKFLQKILTNYYFHALLYVLLECILSEFNSFFKITVRSECLTEMTTKFIDLYIHKNQQTLNTTLTTFESFKAHLWKHLFIEMIFMNTDKQKELLHLHV